MQIIKITLITIFGFIFGQIGLNLTLFDNHASPIWPLAGYSFAILIIYGRNYWPYLFLAALANEMSKTNFQFSWISFAIAASCTFEAFLGYEIFKYFKKKNIRLENYNYPTALILSGTIATLIGAILGVAILVLSRIIPESSIRHHLIMWWSGELLGILTTTTLFLATASHLTQLKTKEFAAQLFFVLTLALILSYNLFAKNAEVDYLIFIFPIIIFIAKFSGILNSYLFVFILQLFAIYITQLNIGPFNFQHSENNYINFQLFFAGLSLTALVMEAIIKSTAEITQSIIIMSIGWSLTFMFAVYFYHFKNEQKKQHFNHLILNIENKINSRFYDYIHVLQSGAALFQASRNLSKEEWKKFTNHLDLYNNYPGINGIGVILPIQNGFEEEYFKQFRNLVDKNIQFKKVPNVELVKADTKYIITLIEPLAFNGPALGLDIGSEQNRRKSAEMAINTGEITMTNKIYLVQDKIKRPGFLMFYPLYNNNYNNIKLKAQNFRAFIYAPFVTEKFFNGVISNSTKQREVDFVVRDFDSSLSDNTLYDSNPQNLSEIEQTTKIQLGKVDYRIQWKKGAAFSTPYLVTTSVVSFVGFVISLLLGVVTSMITSIKERAEKIAIQYQDEADKQRLINIQASRLASLGEMASGIAHEINNPLAIIQGKSQQINRTLKRMNNQPSELTDLSNSIIENTQRIARIIKGLRSFARDGETDPFIATDITTIVEDTISLCQTRFINHNIIFKFPDLIELKKHQIYISCRATQIGQLILNLLNNSFDAIEHLPQKWIELKVEKTDANLIVSIIDSGSGIPDKLKNKIMQPFFTTKEVGKGTGIGLSIAQGIASAHSGNLSIDESSQNTTFILTIPLSTNKNKRTAY